MYIKHVHATMKDVFLGNKGWDNWTRYEYVEGQWKQTKGLRVDDRTNRLIVDRITTWNSNKR